MMPPSSCSACRHCGSASRAARGMRRADLPSARQTEGMEFAQRLTALHEELTRGGMDVRPLVLAPPAVASEVAAVESRLSCSLPVEFRRVLLTVSSRVEFRWFLPRGREFDPPFHQSFSGDLHWSVEHTELAELGRRSWVAEVFPDPNDPYDRVWHGKLAFYEVGNGDYLAFDVEGPNPDRVVYLSHDDGAGHGFVLAEDVFELIARWLPLAFAGGEDWQWLPFTETREAGLRPEGELAAAWRHTLGLASP